MFIVPAMENPIGFLAALSIGTVITAAILILTKKTAVDDSFFDEEDESVDLSELNITDQIR